MLVAVIGLGDIARKAYLPLLTAREGLELVVSSRNAETVHKIQAQYRLKHGAVGLVELIHLQPQAAFVLTPSPTHATIAARLLEAGVDVFLEKPATESAWQTQQLAELAGARQRVLMVGFNRRFAPLHQKARQIWGGSTPGIFLIQKHRPDVYHPDLLSQFRDDTIHQIDMLRYFGGEARVLSTVGEVRQGKLVSAISTVAFERGGYGQVINSLQAGRWSETYTLHGDYLSIQVDAFTRFKVVTREEEKSYEVPYASAWLTTLKARGFEDEIAHFFECVSSRKQPLTSAWDSVKTQQLLEDMAAIAQITQK